MNNTIVPTKICIEPIVKRKSRIVKNADYDIENVIEDPGPNNATWNALTKRKLKERETKIMNRRMNTIQNIVTAEIKSFENVIIKKHTPNISLNSSIYDNIMHENYDLVTSVSKNKLFKLIDMWKGPNVKYMRRTLNTFKEYFRSGKCWCDQKKKTILANDLWIVVFNLILKMINKLSQCFSDELLRQKFQRALLSKVFLRMFQTKWQFPASKPLQLIPFSFIKESQQFKKFLMDNIMDMDPRDFGTTNISAKHLGENVLVQLNMISVESVKQFETNLFLFNSVLDSMKTNNNNEYKYINIKVGNKESVNAFDDSNDRLHAEGTIIDLGSPVNMPSLHTSQMPIGYNGLHNAISIINSPLAQSYNYVQNVTDSNQQMLTSSTVYAQLLQVLRGYLVNQMTLKNE